MKKKLLILRRKIKIIIIMKQKCTLPAHKIQRRVLYLSMVYQAKLGHHNVGTSVVSKPVKWHK